MEANEGARKRSMSRRRLLIGLGAGGVVVGAGGLLGAQHLLRISPPELDQDRSKASLTARELAVLVALSEVLVPARYWVGKEKTEELIHEAVEETPGLAHAYRDGAKLLDEHAGTRFDTLSKERRDSTLAGMVWRYSAPFGRRIPDVRGATRLQYLPRQIELAWLDERHRRFRELVMTDLLERLYVAATPCVLGYNLRGVPNGPRNYVSPPEHSGQGCNNGQGV